MKAPTISSPHKLNHLVNLIQSAPRTASEDWALIKKATRDAISRDTTEWRTEAQLARAASEAADQVAADREIHGFGRLRTLATFEQLRSSNPTHTP